MSFFYTYDPVGNRNPLIQTYDSGNRLLDDGTYTYTYDLNGNMTEKKNKTTLETTTYIYNSEDQLIGVNGNITYKYDALGRRIEKNVAGTITRYIYDGEDIIQELDGTNQITATYTHGPGIDEPICLEKNGQKYYYVSDGLGSITALVDQNGNVAQTYRYDSFGNIINSSGIISQPYAYTGREYDSETGLYYYRHRYYDPHTGRFLQQDPIWSKNLYTYCADNPINLVDPLGLRHGGVRHKIKCGPIDDGMIYNEYGVVIGEAGLEKPFIDPIDIAATIAAGGIVAWANRPYWQYYPAGNPDYVSPWLTRGWGWKPPYSVGSEASAKLSLPPWNPGTAVRQVNTSLTTKISLPGRVLPKPEWGQFSGGGVEYRIGTLFNP